MLSMVAYERPQWKPMPLEMSVVKLSNYALILVDSARCGH
jgi:hypothetical protein